VQMISEVAKVECITPAKGVPDMVFTANAGLVLGNKFVLSHFLHAQRQAEEPYFAQWFANHGFEVLVMPADVPFEGAGDALLDRQSPLLWLGYGHRSSIQCVPLLIDRLDIDIEPLKLINDRFYHLDTCFCPLEDGYLMYYPPAFDAASQARIAARIPAKRRIIVDNEDAFNFACNSVNSGQTIFMNKASGSLVNQLKSRGFVVRQTALTEFMKAGGSAKCLTLKLNETRLSAVPVAA
ncbi:MAG: dimethylarginine dimethylaminohydrolase family protein, partial [Burkholderiaceae bacterium]